MSSEPERRRPSALRACSSVTWLEDRPTAGPAVDRITAWAGSPRSCALAGSSSGRRGAASAMDPPTGVRGSLQVRHVDAGSCNGCEVEISGAFSPVYDAERYGARLVASPRHADALLVTGVVTHNMAQPLRNTFEATPRPRVVIAVGDCARNCGVFAGAYGVAGR